MIALVFFVMLEWEPSFCQQVFAKCPSACYVHNDQVQVECNGDDSDPEPDPGDDNDRSGD